MSVNLYLYVTVRGFRPERETAICEAVDQLMAEFESGWDVGEACSHLVKGPDGVLQTEIWADTADPVIISGAGRWEPEFGADLTRAVIRANGQDCDVSFHTEDADMLHEDRRPPMRRTPRIAR